MSVSIVGFWTGDSPGISSVPVPQCGSRQLLQNDLEIGSDNGNPSGLFSFKYPGSYIQVGLHRSDVRPTPSQVRRADPKPEQPRRSPRLTGILLPVFFNLFIPATKPW